MAEQMEALNGCNLYAYCLNNPVMKTDNNGNNWWTDFWNSTAGAITKIVIGTVAVIGLGVASVLTGGAVGAIVTGAFIGAATAGISSTINAVATGQSLNEFADSFLSGVIVGGVTGAISGIGAPSSSLMSNGLFAVKSLFQYATFQVAANALIGSATYVTDAIKNKQKMSFNGLAISTIAGDVGGLIPSGLRGIFMTTALDYITNALSSLLD